MQERFWSFRDDDLTARLDNWLLGIHYPGRYCGFDFEATNTNNLKLIHTRTGIQYNSKDNFQKQFVGVVITNVGVAIKEDASIELAIQPNSSTKTRVDLVYLQHKYLDGVVGGQQASYGVIEGIPSDDYIKPSLVDPVNQIVIGYLIIPKNTLNVTTSCRWEQEKRPTPSKGIWNQQLVKESVSELSGTTSVVFVKPEISTKNYEFSISNNNNGQHELKIFNEVNQDLGKSFFFNFKGNETLGDLFSLKITHETSVDITVEIVSFDKYDFKNGDIRIKLIKTGAGKYRVHFLDYDEKHFRGKQNRSDLAVVYSSSNIAQSVVSGSYLQNKDDKWPSHILVSNSILHGLEQYDGSAFKPGTRILIEAGNDLGLTLQAQFSIGRQTISRRDFLFGSSIGLVQANAPSVNLIKVQKGQIVELIVSNQGDICVVNELFSNRVISLERELAGETYYATFTDGNGVNSGEFFAKKVNGIVTFHTGFVLTPAFKQSGVLLLSLPEVFAPTHLTQFNVTDTGGGQTLIRFNDKSDRSIRIFSIISGQSITGNTTISGSYLA